MDQAKKLRFLITSIAAGSSFRPKRAAAITDSIRAFAN